MIEKYNYDSPSFIFYDFYSPITGDKIDISNECQNRNITIETNIISLLKGIDNINIILNLAKQNINIFDKSNVFYNDICFNYISPNGKDIPMKDRLKEFYPNITLCNEGCLLKRINLTSMKSECQCHFSDFIGSNFFTQNVFIHKISEEIVQTIFKSNLEILLCYKEIFIYKFFAKNIGGFIILVFIIYQICCVIFFYFKHFRKMNRFIFFLMEVYLSFLDKSNIEKDRVNIISFFNNFSSYPPKRNDIKIKKKKNKHKTVIYHNNTNTIKLNINKIEVKNLKVKKGKKRKKKIYLDVSSPYQPKTNKKINNLSSFKLAKSDKSDNHILKKK